MSFRRIQALLLAIATVLGLFVVAVPPASAHIVCDSGEFYKVTSHSYTFNQVDAVQLVNHKNYTATLHFDVGEAHTSSRSFSGSITVGVEAGFWVFAKAKAEATAGVTIQSSSTMSKTYGASVTLPGKGSATIKFGFRRYNQYVKAGHYYLAGMTTCGIHWDHEGWVRAPYKKAFIID